jgi:hypothetical protein
MSVFWSKCSDAASGAVEVGELLMVIAVIISRYDKEIGGKTSWWCWTLRFWIPLLAALVLDEWFEILWERLSAVNVDIIQDCMYTLVVAKSQFVQMVKVLQINVSIVSWTFNFCNFWFGNAHIQDFWIACDFLVLCTMVEKNVREQNWILTI